MKACLQGSVNVLDNFTILTTCILFYVGCIHESIVCVEKWLQMVKVCKEVKTNHNSVVGYIFNAHYVHCLTAWLHQFI